MSKVRDISNLSNVIRTDASGNVSFVSGSTTLATINTSGQLSGSSPVLSSSYALNATSASYAVSASNATNAVTASFANAFTVANTLTATTLIVQTVSSSVIYSSGSNVFGNNITNTQTFTGSVLISGSSTAFNVNSGSFFISSSGNIGINTTNPTDLLHLYKSGTVYQKIETVSGGAGTIYRRSNSPTPDWTIGHGAASANENFEVYTAGTGSFVWTMNGADRMRITATGSIGIGTSSTSGKLTLYQGTAGNVLQSIVSNQGGSTRVGINFCPSMADSEAAISPAQASIYATDYNYSADIIFANKLTGAVGNALTERMRITSGGNVFIGYVNTGVTDTRMYISAIGTTSANFALVIKQSNNTQNLFYVRDDGFINTGLAAVSPYNNTSGAAANLVVTGAGGLERTVSSLKYKTDVKDYDKGLSEVLKMRPVYYKSINKREKDLQFAGLIAEEIHDLGLTEFVQYADDGTPDALAYQNMVALLTKAIQEINTKSEEQQALITSLQEQINELKNK